MSDPVHYSDWAQQPDIGLACGERWTTPKWGAQRSNDTDVGIYESDDGRLYAFDEEKVTCPACLAFIQAHSDA